MSVVCLADWLDGVTCCARLFLCRVCTVSVMLLPGHKVTFRRVSKGCSQAAPGR